MKNRITKRFVAAAILCVLMVALAVPAFAAGYSKIYGLTSDRIRVRASASSTATVIDNLVKDACVYITDSKTSGNTTYVKVTYRNLEGNLSTGWLCQKDSKTTYVKLLNKDWVSKNYGVKDGALPNKKVGTFKESQRKQAAETTSSTTSSSSNSTETANVKRAQTILKALGYYAGEVTGNVGAKTETAIKKFQGEYELTRDGKLGTKTMAKLESVYASRGGSVTTTSSASATTGLKLGSSGTKVRDLQLDLTTLGYYWAEVTGNFGAKTETAVKNFQKKNNLPVDGVAGTKTLNAIASAIARKGGSSSSSSYVNGAILKEGSQGTAVSNLQTDLKQLGYYYATVTGNFGAKTGDAVRAFQKAKGLPQDGVAGPKTLAAVAEAVKKAGGSVNNASTGLKLGSTGEKVRALQNDLTALGYYYGDITGHYGSMTETAVKRFQKAKGMTQDGVAGTTTLAAITKALGGSSSSGSSSSSSSTSGGKTLREGDKGNAVLDLQTRLNKLGYYYGSLTGSYGSLTKKAVRAFQSAQKLTVDGVAGPTTLNKLYALTGGGSVSTGSTSSSGSTATEADSYGRVNKNNVNLRTSYSTSSAAKASLNEGKTLRITRIHNVAGVKWYYVTVKVGSVTHKGYLRSDMVTLIKASDYVDGDVDLGDDEIRGMIRVTGTSVNLRSEPSTNGDKVGTAKKGDVFYYVAHKSGWYQTKAGYWIDDNYAKAMTDAEVNDYLNSDTNDSNSYRLNDTGTMVQWIQDALRQLKYYTAESTGHYGAKTEEAVRQFQRDNGLSADGVAGPKTIQAIINAVSKDYTAGAGTAVYKGSVYNVDWFANKGSILKTGETATVIDISRNLTFKIKVQSTGNHADVEPLTAADTKVLCSLYGVANANQLNTQNKYQRRAVVVENKDGKQFVGSMYAIPHGLNTVSGNNFEGQFCIHFLNSKTHGSDRVDTDTAGHQDMIERGVTALEAIMVDGKKAVTVFTTL